jgi:hypothetical protein
MTGAFVADGQPSEQKVAIRLNLDRRRRMKTPTLAAVALLLAAVPGFAIHIEGPRYPSPPARPSVSSWPEGLAGVIADKSYLDGYNYQNPGYVTEDVDTFYYGGDTEALNVFLEKMARVKGLRVTVAFSGGEGKVNRFVRAETVRQLEVLGLPLSRMDGEPCSWLVSVTPKDWVRQPRGGRAEAEARVLIFLGGKRIDAENLRLPAWED